MSRKLLLLAASVALFSGAATFAKAADIIDPPVIDLPEPVMPTVHAATGGWYIRSDIGYSQNKMSEVDYITASVVGGQGVLGNNILRGNLSNSYSVGAGIGYDTGNYLRFDLTADYFAKANFKGSTSGTCTPNPLPPLPAPQTIACTTTDTATYSAISVMANAYVDIGKFGGFTPYVGAGIGGTHVTWSKLSNKFDQSVTNPDELHPGGSEMRFTYALMAGASYDVTDCIAGDAGYRYRKVAGGHMFGIGDGGAVGGVSSTGGGKDRGITSHDFRVGARFKLAGLSGGCGSASHVPDYQPDYQPVYK